MTALGKEAATKEDIRDVLEKLSAVTNTTKQIESKIDGALWEQQNRWQNKREFYLEIVGLGREDHSGLAGPQQVALLPASIRSRPISSKSRGVFGAAS